MTVFCTPARPTPEPSSEVVGAAFQRDMVAWLLQRLVREPDSPGVVKQETATAEAKHNRHATRSRKKTSLVTNHGNAYR